MNSLLAGLLTFAGLTSALAGTACCTNQGDCSTISGTTDDGLHWCYGYHEGDIKFGDAALDVGRCMVNLHFTQDVRCISVAGSPCEGRQTKITAVQEGHWQGSNQLSAESSRAIQAAMQAAHDNGLSYSDDELIGPGFLEFAHVADNGGGIAGVDVFTKDNPYGC